MFQLMTTLFFRGQFYISYYVLSKLLVQFFHSIADNETPTEIDLQQRCLSGHMFCC